MYARPRNPTANLYNNYDFFFLFLLRFDVSQPPVYDNDNITSNLVGIAYAVVPNDVKGSHSIFSSTDCS